MPNEEPDKLVRISLNPSGLPVADPDPAPVKKDKQKVKWSATFPFTIEINGSTVPSTPGGGDHGAKSGPFPHPVTTKIKYSITANGQTNDPDIEILP